MYELRDMSDTYPDIVVGELDFVRKNLYLHSQDISPISSHIVKKIMTQFGLKSASFTPMDDTIKYSKKKIVGDVPAIVFHGTSSDKIESILQNGLFAGGGNSPYEKTIIHDEHVFFTSEFDYSKEYAYSSVRAAGTKSSLPIIIELNVPDKSKLSPDWDSDAVAKKDQRYYYSTASKPEYSTMKSMALSNHQGRWGYKGKILPQSFRWIWFYQPHSKKWKKLKPSTMSKFIDKWDGIDELKHYLGIGSEYGGHN